MAGVKDQVGFIVISYWPADVRIYQRRFPAFRGGGPCTVRKSSLLKVSAPPRNLPMPSASPLSRLCLAAPELEDVKFFFIEGW